MEKRKFRWWKNFFRRFAVDGIWLVLEEELAIYRSDTCRDGTIKVVRDNHRLWQLCSQRCDIRRFSIYSITFSKRSFFAYVPNPSRTCLSRAYTFDRSFILRICLLASFFTSSIDSLNSSFARIAFDPLIAFYPYCIKNTKRYSVRATNKHICSKRRGIYLYRYEEAILLKQKSYMFERSVREKSYIKGLKNLPSVH